MQQQQKKNRTFFFILIHILIRQWAVFLAKILLKSDRACANAIIYAAIDFSLQNISGVYLT